MGEGIWVVGAALVVQLGTLAGIIVTAREQRKTAKQLRPNGGSSVADAINRIESRVDRQSEDIGAIKKDVAGVKKRLDDHIDGR